MAERWARYNLTAELLSDAHFGSGSGGGGIDALVARDRRGHPVIWASHLEGVLRDAARRLRGSGAAEEFFGRAGGDRHRSDRQRAVFTSLYAKDHPEIHVWRSTARVAFDNRAPKDDTLRVAEYVPRGTTLAGEVELPAREVPLLRRLVQEVDALGRGRSTGAGRVRLSLSELATASRMVGPPSGRLLLLLLNRDPLCITATATPDNLIPTLSFVPGRTLLGAIAAWLIAEGDRDTASLLTSGRIAVGDALPLARAPKTLENVEVLPAPLSLKSEKAQGSASVVPWWARAKVPTRRLDAMNTDEKLKRAEDDLFVHREAPNDPWATSRPARRVRLRNGRPDPKQADASLFAIEQIVEDTHFVAELRGSAEAMKQLAEKLAPVLQGIRWLRVGRGGAPVEVVDLAWPQETAIARAPDKALLTLTSDLLVRDEHLRWRTALDEGALRDVLGEDVRLGRSLQEGVMVHGFNGTSRLWRMPAAAIRRGSVFELSGEGVPKLAQRAALGQWLGDRRHEGFGRFRLDAVLPGVTGEPRANTPSDPTADAQEEAIAKDTREWFEQHKALAEADCERAPSLSQWLDLVADLERADASAFDRRLHPTTAGAKTWEHEDAKAILQALEALQPAERGPHARLFVRWLRADLRGESQKKGAA